MSTEDRRAPGIARIPFDGLVEVGGALGPSFEAQGVNLSEEGMLLRTAYLPETGQPLTCRFDAGTGESVLASGEVAWTHAAERGGEFAVRFTEMDPESVDALKRACGLAAQSAPAAQPGSKVRLHIDGLASPMRAKVRDAGGSGMTVGSDLGFLQVGRPLELEDAQSGSKRPAHVDRVEVALDPASHVPQLVVTLRYEDTGAEPSTAEAHAQNEGGAAQGGVPRGSDPGARPRSSVAPREMDGSARDAADANRDVSVEEASIRMKGAVARHAARIGPALGRWANQAKTTIALLAARHGRRPDDGAAPRRTTAPPPGGGLHAAGRRVVRGEPGGPAEESAPKAKITITKRKVAIAGAVMGAAILGAVALKKTHHDGPEAAAGARDPVGSATAQAAAGSLNPTSPMNPANASIPMNPPGVGGFGNGAMSPPGSSPAGGGSAFSSPFAQGGAVANASDDPESSGKGGHRKHGRPAPFGNGPVHHGNVLRLKLDGAIDAIEGAQQPTGFAVKIPGRKSLESAGPLASRDSRIASIRVANDAAGAELTVAFKDGVPNYQVSGKGDTLLIALAPAGQLPNALAKSDAKGGKAPKHAKHEHKKSQSK
jgi:hypothetical protein